jgi:UDP-N-acetylenolpyruvoylglucosamine reductase
VSTEHANVFVTREGATASDVQALTEIVRAAVARQFGVVLETEVVFFG